VVNRCGSVAAADLPANGCRCARAGKSAASRVSLCMTARKAKPEIICDPASRGRTRQYRAIQARQERKPDNDYAAWTRENRAKNNRRMARLYSVGRNGNTRRRPVFYCTGGQSRDLSVPMPDASLADQRPRGGENSTICSERDGYTPVGNCALTGSSYQREEEWTKAT